MLSGFELYSRWVPLTIAGYEELTGGFKPIRNGEIIEL